MSLKTSHALPQLRLRELAGLDSQPLNPSAPVRPRWPKPLEFWLSRQIVLCLSILGRLTPRAGCPIGRGLGWCCFAGMRRYRRVAIKNLQRAYEGEWDERQLRRVARASFEHRRVTLAEFFLWLPRLSLEQARLQIRERPELSSWLRNRWKLQPADAAVEMNPHPGFTLEADARSPLDKAETFA